MFCDNEDKFKASSFVSVPTEGGCGSGLVPAHPDPGESHSFGPGREGCVGPSEDRLWKDSRLRCPRPPAHPGIQTGEEKDSTDEERELFSLRCGNMNLQSFSHWFALSSQPFVLFFVFLTTLFVFGLCRVFVSRT